MWEFYIHPLQPSPPGTHRSTFCSGQFTHELLQAQWSLHLDAMYRFGALRLDAMHLFGALRLDAMNLFGALRLDAMYLFGALHLDAMYLFGALR